MVCVDTSQEVGQMVPGQRVFAIGNVPTEYHVSATVETPMDIARSIFAAFVLKCPGLDFAAGEWTFHQKNCAIADFLAGIDANSLWQSLDVAPQI